MNRGVISIKTTKPKPGRTARYHDSISEDGFFRYAFQGTDPNNRDNTALRQAWEDKTPFIYLFGLLPGVYKILWPCFAVSWNSVTLTCEVAVGSLYEIGDSMPQRSAEAPDRAYATVKAKVRIHQAEFRQLVLKAYGNRCAVSNLPIPELLDAAHIIPDRDERGRPEVPNGLCLSKLHHTAYDRNLLGISPDGIVHIAEPVRQATDGPTLEHGIKAFHLAPLRCPRAAENRPNRDFLSERFEEFQRAW